MRLFDFQWFFPTSTHPKMGIWVDLSRSKKKMRWSISKQALVESNDWHHSDALKQLIKEDIGSWTSSHFAIFRSIIDSREVELILIALWVCCTHWSRCYASYEAGFVLGGMVLRRISSLCSTKYRCFSSKLQQFCRLYVLLKRNYALHDFRDTRRYNLYKRHTIYTWVTCSYVQISTAAYINQPVSGKLNPLDRQNYWSSFLSTFSINVFNGSFFHKSNRLIASLKEHKHR